MDDKTVTYFVNDNPYDTTEKKLKVRTILSGAGFTPVEQYDLTRVNGHHLFSNLDEDVPIHKDEKFLAVFKGTTPVS